MMNANSTSAHNQKDFFDAFLGHIDDPHPHAAHSGPVPISEVLNTNIRAGQYLSQANMQQQPMQNGVGMDVLEGLMAMQDTRGGGGPSNALPNASQPTPQMLMEHQMRLNQLQQLYQLQTQIFQQQVRFLSHCVRLGRGNPNDGAADLAGMAHLRC